MLSLSTGHVGHFITDPPAAPRGVHAPPGARRLELGHECEGTLSALLRGSGPGPRWGWFVCCLKVLHLVEELMTSGKGCPHPWAGDTSGDQPSAHLRAGNGRPWGGRGSRLSAALLPPDLAVRTRLV